MVVPFSNLPRSCGSAEHTREPWKWEPGYTADAALIVGPGRLAIGVFTGPQARENAARAVMCVNAMRGISHLEGSQSDDSHAAP